MKKDMNRILYRKKTYIFLYMVIIIPNMVITFPNIVMSNHNIVVSYSVRYYLYFLQNISLMRESKKYVATKIKTEVTESGALF